MQQSNIKPERNRKQKTRPNLPPDGLDVIAIDIMQRLVKGEEPAIRPEFRGLRVPAEDLALAVEFTLGQLKVLSPRGRERAKDLDMTAKEARKTFLALADSHGLIFLPSDEAAPSA